MCFAGSRMIPIHFPAEDVGPQVKGKKLGVSVNGAVSMWGGYSVDFRIGDTAHRAAPVRAVKDSQGIPKEGA